MSKRSAGTGIILDCRGAASVRLCPDAAYTLRLHILLACCSRAIQCSNSTISPPPPAFPSPPPLPSPSFPQPLPSCPLPLATHPPPAPCTRVTERAVWCRYELKLHGSCHLDSPCYSLATAPAHPDETATNFGACHNDAGPQVIRVQAALDCVDCTLLLSPIIESEDHAPTD